MSRSGNSLFDGDDEVDPDNPQRLENEELGSEELQRSMKHEAQQRGMQRLEQIQGRSPAKDRRVRVEHSSNSPMREGLPKSGFHLRRAASMEDMIELVCKKMGDGFDGINASFDGINARLAQVEKNQHTLEKNQNLWRQAIGTMSL